MRASNFSVYRALLGSLFMRSVVGIYNSDSGVFGEITYLVNKTLARSRCSLCDLTHGWNPFGRTSWKKACSETSVIFSFLHRDEATNVQLASVSDLPVIATIRDGEWVCVVTATELTEHCDNPDWLITKINSYFGL